MGFITTRLCFVPKGSLCGDLRQAKVLAVVRGGGGGGRGWERWPPCADA